jgi:hypothetical protein
MPALPEQRVRIFHRCSLPFLILEIVGKQSNSCRLFSIPTSHTPQALEYCLLLQSKVEQTAIYRILHVAFGVLISGDDFELGFLKFGQCQTQRATGSYHTKAL